MATPFGHAMTGLTLYHLFRPAQPLSAKKSGVIYGLVILGACAPDLDFLPGLLFLDPGRFHHGLWHSLGAALLFSSAAGLGVRRFLGTSSFFKTGGFVFLLFFSHLFLDFFTEDPIPPFGFPLFWPLHQDPVISPLSLFPYVLRHPNHRDFWGHSFLSLAVEGFLLLPFFILSLRNRGRSLPFSESPPHPPF